MEEAMQKEEEEKAQKQQHESLNETITTVTTGEPSENDEARNELEHEERSEVEKEMETHVIKETTDNTLESSENTNSVHLNEPNETLTHPQTTTEHNHYDQPILHHAHTIEGEVEINNPGVSGHLNPLSNPQSIE
jgi:hypothetical protein